MNIFASNPSPVISAINLDDLRVNKMILETAQLLSTAVFWRNQAKYKELGLYRPTHMNHPCSVWTRRSNANFIWLTIHGLVLCDLYSDTSKKVHKSQEIIEKCAPLHDAFDNEKISEFADCSSYKDNTLLNIFEKYQHTLVDKWDSQRHLPTWRNRPVPSFWESIHDTDTRLRITPHAVNVNIH